jgi:MYXO-CTERM domain-containing protein
MDVDFSKIGRAFWFGIGSPAANTGGEFAWNNADNVAFQFQDNNNVDLHESDNAAITIDSNLDPTTITSIELEVTTASFTDGAAANYDLLVNGSSIDARSFTWTSSENYITFGGWDYRSDDGEGPVYIDTLSVSTIPEPGAATLLLGVAGLLLLRRRR